MLQAGRNDPCPCGSGKKFKNCCMRQARVQAARAVNQSALDMALFRDMMRYVAQPRHGNDLAEGMALFWGGRFTDKALAAMDADDGRRFVEWFLHDYLLGDEQKRPIDLFMEREGAKYPEEARQVMVAWADSAMAMLRHVRRVGDDRIAVYDPLREAELEVVSRLMATNARPGDLLVGRLYELEGSQRLSAATLILPGEYEQPLTDYMRNAYRLYCDQHYDATWDRFMRRHGYIMNTYLFSDRAQALRGLIGAGTRFYDPAATRDRMREIQHSQREQDTRSELMTMRDLEPQMRMRHTAGGIVLPGAEEPQEERPAEEKSPRKPTILIPGRDG